MKTERYEIWRGGDGYEKHRIPGLLVTQKGTLLMYHEARRDRSDWALMDILLTRSEDFGKTCGEAIVLASGTAEKPTVNNPVMVQDQKGRIHLLYCRDYSIDGGGAWRRYSDDDGLTWSEPVEITAFTRPEFRNAFAFGPGHGICATDGTLLVPVWMVPQFYESPMRAHKPSMAGVFYSRDNGETWRLGDLLGSNLELQSPNESSMAQLPDGRFYLNMRCANYWRAGAYSATGYDGWQDYGPQKSLIDPVCFGAVAAYAPAGEPPLLLLANCESKTKRANVVLKASKDGGRTWPHRLVIDPDRGGYVEINADAKNRNVYVLYEEDEGAHDYLAVLHDLRFDA